MNLYDKFKQKKINPVRYIAHEVGVSEEYVRLILTGKRKGNIHCDGKGEQITSLAQKLLAAL